MKKDSRTNLDLLNSANAKANAPVPAKAGRVLPVSSQTRKKAIAFAIAFFLVRETGLEPVRCEPHAPQTCASASSATPACASCTQHTILYTIFSKCQVFFQKKSKFF